MGYTENGSPTFLSSGFYSAALWLHCHHPKTLTENVVAIVDFGYYKDLLEILFRVLEGAEARKLVKGMRAMRRCSWPIQTVIMRGRGVESANHEEKSKSKSILTREEKRIERAKRVVERFNEDPHFKFLHEQVSDLFAQRITLLCETIAKKVFPREEYVVEYEGVEEVHYTYRVRNRLRKEVLVPLRKALQLPELYMGASDWGSLPYNRIASVAMKMYKLLFFKHEEERFKKFLERVKSGEAKIAAGALLPHQIITALDDIDGGQVAELQWKRMVDDMAKIGKLNNCLAICDVSGSMYGILVEISVALGMLVSELSEEPWKGKLITFSQNPKLQIVEGEILKAKKRFVSEMDWGMNTNFQRVFDVMLEVAVKGKLKAKEMIKRLFVFSDMEFDQASLNPWETDYQVIMRKYTEKGYGECVPEI
ncbi:hypothetical protein C2S51_028206 [Perilla frutescens var. frutescens]|nr:hypothetical protein C2S51_028206 [Perilla frutescens var. frutescens]